MFAAKNASNVSYSRTDLSAARSSSRTTACNMFLWGRAFISLVGVWLAFGIFGLSTAAKTSGEP